MEEKKKKKQEEKTDVTQKKVRENLLHRVTPCLAWKFLCFERRKAWSYYECVPLSRRRFNKTVRDSSFLTPKNTSMYPCYSKVAMHLKNLAGFISASRFTQDIYTFCLQSWNNPNPHLLWSLSLFFSLFPSRPLIRSPKVSLLIPYKCIQTTDEALIISN